MTCTDPWWWVATCVTIDLLCATVHTLIEHRIARWLPWYRRYLSTLLWVIAIALYAANGRYAKAAHLAAALLAIAALQWNAHTARRNRDKGDDQRKREAERSERLTEAQQSAFQREVLAQQ